MADVFVTRYAREIAIQDADGSELWRGSDVLGALRALRDTGLIGGLYEDDASGVYTCPAPCGTAVPLLPAMKPLCPVCGTRIPAELRPDFAALIP